MNYQKITLVGYVMADAQHRTSKDGVDTYTTFSIGVGDSRERTEVFPIIAFGEWGQRIAKYVTKGRHILVDGRIEVGNKGRFKVIAKQIRLGVEPKAAKAAKKAK